MLHGGATMAVAALALLAAWGASASSPCPPQRLTVTDMEGMGVWHVSGVRGKIDSKEIFELRAFVRLKKSPQGRLQLYGLAWLAYVDRFSGYQPELRDIQEIRMKNMSLVAMNPDWTEAGFVVPINATHTWNKKEHVKNFRMDVDVQLPPQLQHLHYFQLRMHNWDPVFALDAHRHPSYHNVILPWHAMPSTAAGADGALGDSHRHKRSKATLSAEPGHHEGGAAGLHAADAAAAGAPSPLVVAVALSQGASTDVDSNRMVHQAQALIRHAEYHLGQLKMQRMLVYIYPFIFNSPAFHDYLTRHMPPELLPYVTFVLWTNLPINGYPHIWQLAMYYHATVALWGYGNVRVANIDLDEYIAFSGPQATLQQALERCGAGQVDVVELANEFVSCPTCQALYGDNNHADATTWATAETELAKVLADPRLARTPGAVAAAVGAEAAGASWRCRWWNQDPLHLYSLRWNDKWFASIKVKRSDRLRYDVVNLNRGKVLLQPERIVAYNWHHADALDPTRQVILDPDHGCPYVAHMLHLFGARETRQGGAKKLYTDPAIPTSWWLLDAARPPA